MHRQITRTLLGGEMQRQITRTLPDTKENIIKMENSILSSNQVKSSQMFF